MTTRSIIAILYAWFTTSEEAKQVLEKLKKEYCGDLTVKKGFYVQIHFDTEQDDADLITEILGFFDRTKVIEGYVDLYVHSWSQAIPLEKA